MQYDEELARMRAQMLAKEEEEPPVFDDGARFLGQDPNMMQVGFNPQHVTFVPIAALFGDCVIERSPRISWCRPPVPPCAAAAANRM